MGGYVPALGLQTQKTSNGGRLPDEPAPYLCLPIFQARNLAWIGKTPALCDTQQRIEALMLLEQTKNTVGHLKSLSNK
jgi:hypothetical protein